MAINLRAPRAETREQRLVAITEGTEESPEASAS